jgi:hypothetical protein
MTLVVGIKEFKTMNAEELDKEFKRISEVLSQQFGDGAAIDMQGILFLIGVQELGMGFQKFKKDDKLAVMHIAICTLLERYGYYEFEGRDDDNWPHFKLNEKLPPLKPAQQHLLMRDAIVEYFKEQGI